MNTETIINAVLLGIPAAFSLYFLTLTVRRGY